VVIMMINILMFTRGVENLDVRCNQTELYLVCLYTRSGHRKGACVLVPIVSPRLKDFNNSVFRL
jgi:hypothetical protein